MANEGVVNLALSFVKRGMSFQSTPDSEALRTHRFDVDGSYAIQRIFTIGTADTVLDLANVPAPSYCFFHNLSLSNQVLFGGDGSSYPGKIRPDGYAILEFNANDIHMIADTNCNVEVLILPRPSTTPPAGLLLVTTQDSEEVLKVACDGSTTVFATLPGDNSAIERYVAIAPTGSTGFTVGNVFVTRGKDIYQIPAAGGSATLFVNIAAADDSQTGICFDTTGNFGGDMIVTSTNGKIWRVTSSAVVTLVADLAGDGVTIRNPCIPPSSFGTYGGQIWAADYLYNGFGSVHAIDSSGTLTPEIIDWFAAASCTFVPSGSGGSTAGALATITGIVGVAASNTISSLCNHSFFVSIFNTNTLYAYPGSSIPTASVLVASEFGGGIGIVTWNGSSYDTNTFDGTGSQFMTGAAVIQ